MPSPLTPMGACDVPRSWSVASTLLFPYLQAKNHLSCVLTGTGPSNPLYSDTTPYKNTTYKRFVRRQRICFIMDTLSISRLTMKFVSPLGRQRFFWSFCVLIIVRVYRMISLEFELVCLVTFFSLFDLRIRRYPFFLV